MLIFRSFVLVCASTLFALSAQADRTITDQLGRQVTIPDHVDKVVMLQHQTLNILVQLNAQQDIAGVMSSWKKQLGPKFVRFMPTVTTLSTPGDLASVNIESLLTIHPRVAFVANYAPAEMIQQIQNAGIPAVAIPLHRDTTGQQNEMNPTMADEEQVYNEGLKQGTRLIADVVGRKPQAETLIDYVFAARPKFNAPVAKIPNVQKVRIYMANPDLMTYGSGKYMELMMQHVRGLNATATSAKGAHQVALEQVLAWNPQVIFIQDRYPQAVTEIQNDPSWQGIDAVKNHRVWLMPEYAKAWGYPMPEASAIGELWMAEKLYPDAYKNVDVGTQTQDYYQRFYRVNQQPDAAK